MPKAVLSETAKLRVIRETALYRCENPDDPASWSPELTADVSALNAMEGHEVPAGAMPGPGMVPMQQCELIHIVDVSAWIIDMKTKIYAPKSGILRAL